MAIYDDFVLYFSNLFKINIDNLDISLCMPCVVDPTLDSPIEYWELVSVRKLNNKKVLGDGLCCEFYKNAPNCFLKEILGVFSKFFLQESIPDSLRISI